MMTSKVITLSFIFMILSLISIPPINASGAGCSGPGQSHGGRGRRHGSSRRPVYPPTIIRPPPSTGAGGGGGGGSGGRGGISPPPPPRGGGGGITPPSPPPPGGGITPPPPPPTSGTCPIDALRLGLCLDVLSGLIHVGIGNPAENICCPVIQGLLELEAAICLCTTIRLRLLNLEIFIPIALQVLITCGLNPPPNFVCPPLT